MDLRATQQPLKDRYRTDPATAQITLRASGSRADAPVACSVDLGRAVYEAQAHEGVGGAGTAACSGDLLLGALAACAQLTCQMVATAMGIEAERIEVSVEGDLDLAERSVWRATSAPDSLPYDCGSRSTHPPPPRISSRRFKPRPSAPAPSCRR